MGSGSRKGVQKFNRKEQGNIRHIPAGGKRARPEKGSAVAEPSVPELFPRIWVRPDPLCLRPKRPRPRLAEGLCSPLELPTHGFLDIQGIQGCGVKSGY